MALRLRFGSDQLYLEPVTRRLGAAKIVAQQRRRLIQVHDHHVHVAIVIEVAEGAPAAGMQRRHPWTSLLNQLFKLPLPRFRKTRRGVL